MYDRFADDALYSINIANPVTGALMTAIISSIQPGFFGAGKL